MIRFRGRITPRVIASRSSATFLPEKSSPRAAAAALSPAWRAPFCACCWRPRAFPPAFAARLRAVLLPLEDDLLVPDALRALEVDRRVEEPEDDELDELRLCPPEEPDPLELRPRPPEDPEDELADLRAPEPLLPDGLRALELRELELRVPELRELDARELDEDELGLRALDPRELDPDDFRAPDPPPDDFLRDEPPPLPEPDSAMCSSSSEALRTATRSVRAGLYAQRCGDVRVVRQREQRSAARRLDQLQPA
jgi:hypothetical protein